MAILKEKDRQTLHGVFKSSLKEPVRLLMFTQEIECQYCQITREMAQDIAELSPLISLEIKDFVRDSQKAKEYGVDKIPALLVQGVKENRIRFYGVPAGYEFNSFIEAIVDVSKNATGLSKEITHELAKLKKPVHLEVMVSPTCPFCPRAVRVAHQLALESPLITADMIEITEFPHLAVQHNVHGVPHTIINGSEHVAGAISDTELVKKIVAIET